MPTMPVHVSEPERLSGILLRDSALLLSVLDQKCATLCLFAKTPTDLLVMCPLRSAIGGGAGQLCNSQWLAPGQSQRTRCSCGCPWRCRAGFWPGTAPDSLSHSGAVPGDSSPHCLPWAHPQSGRQCSLHSRHPAQYRQLYQFSSQHARMQQTCSKLHAYSVFNAGTCNRLHYN